MENESGQLHDALIYGQYWLKVFWSAVDDLIDPGHEVLYPGVDADGVLLAALCVDAVADHAHLDGGGPVLTYHQR